jgi:hypothetical protein
MSQALLVVWRRDRYCSSRPPSKRCLESGMRRPAHRGRFGWVVALYFWNCLDREEAVDVGNQMGRGVVVDTDRPRIADLDDHVVCHSRPNTVIEIRGVWPWLVAWKDRDEASCQRFVDDIVGQPGLAATLQPVLTTQYQRMTVVDMASLTRATIDRGLICTNSAGDRSRWTVSSSSRSRTFPPAPRSLAVETGLSSGADQQVLHGNGCDATRPSVQQVAPHAQPPLPLSPPPAFS